MNNKCIIFESALVSPHTETGIELAILEDEAGNDVYYAPIFMNLLRVETWLGNDEQIYTTRLKIYSDRIRAVISQHAKFIEFANIVPPSIPINESSDLFSLYLNNFPIGATIHSTLTFLTKSSEVNLKDGNILDYAQMLYVIGYQSYMLSLAIIKKIKPSIVYTCNGRFTSQAATKYACLKLGVNYMLHERGSDKNSFTLQTEIHDIKFLNNYIQEFSNNFSQKRIELSASAFFNSIYKRKKSNWGTFTQNQEYGYIPDHLKGINYVTYYVSSDDEFETLTINDLNIGLGSQRQAFKILKRACLSNDIHLVIRIHPHIFSKSQKEQEFWSNQKALGCTVIESNSKVDSYALLEGSAIVIAYISSVGIEASYRKKPVIALGRSMWYYSEEIMKPRTQKELEDCLNNPSKPSTNNGAKIYGCYEQNKGISHTHYQPKTDASGIIAGVDLFGDVKLEELSFIKHE